MRTSSAPVIGWRPSASRAFVPTDAGLRTEPGTTSTSMPRASAASTVWSDPPRSCDSTTITASARAAMMRLRAGKRQRSGVMPRRRLGQQHAAGGHRSPQVGVAGRVRDVEAVGRHADGRHVAVVERTPVGGAVDAAARPDDRHPAAVRCAPARVPRRPRCRSAPGADDGHPRPGDDLGRPEPKAPRGSMSPASAGG